MVPGAKQVKRIELRAPVGRLRAAEARRRRIADFIVPLRNSLQTLRQQLSSRTGAP